MSLGAGEISIKYLATGEKLQKRTSSDQGETTVDYCGNIEYENGELAAIHHSTGRIIPSDNETNGPFRYQFQLTDHLGNVRIVFEDKNQDGSITKINPDRGSKNPFIIDEEEIITINHYYPFGLQMTGPALDDWGGGANGRKYDYSYNGKELNEDFGLDWSDYGARWYDAAIGRWGAVDPLAEDGDNISWTPYTYVWNNPMNAIDPDGRNGIITVDKKNKTIKIESTIHYSKEDFANSRNFTGKHSLNDFVKGLVSSINDHFQSGDVEVDGESYSVSTVVTFEAHENDVSRDEATSSGDDKIEFMPFGLSNGSYTGGYGEKGGKFNIPKSNSSVNSPIMAHEFGHSFGLSHEDGKIYEEPNGVMRGGGKKGKRGSLMSYASDRRMAPSEMSKVVSPAVRMAKKKKKLLKYRVYSNRAPKRIKR